MSKLLNVFVDGLGNFGDNVREIVVIVATGHNTKEIGFLRVVNDATVVELSFLGIVIESFAKLVREGGAFGKEFAKPIFVVGFGKKGKSLFGHFLVEVGGVVENTEEGGVFFNGDIVVGVVDNFLRIYA